FLAINNLFKLNIPRYTSLLNVIVIATFVAYIVFRFPQIVPVLITEIGVTSFNIIMEYNIIFIFLISIPSLKRQLNTHSIIINYYLFTAICLAIIAELTFTLYIDAYSYYFSLGHLFKLASYYYLYQAIVVGSLHHPYNQLKLKNKQIANMLDDVPVGIIAANEMLHITFINREAVHMLGFESHELIGKSLINIINDMLTEPINRKTLQWLNSDHLINFSPIIEIKNNCNQYLNIKFERRQMDGSLYIYQLTPAQKELDFQNLQLQTLTILDSVRDMVIVTDRNGRIVLCNKAFENLTALYRKDIQGLMVEDLLFMLRINRRPILNEGQLVEFSFKPVNGMDSIDFLLGIDTIFNLNGDTIGYVYSATDITRVKQEHLKLRQQEKLAVVGQMAAGIVHEIKNPLTTIKGFSQILKQGIHNMNDVHEFARIIESTTDELDRIVVDFLSFARPRTPVYSKININDLIDSIAPLIEGTIFMQGVQITYSKTAEAYFIISDVGQIKQVLFNLIKNAVEAVGNHPKPNIEISTGYNAESSLAFIKVSDNGKGIDESTLSKLGTPFFTTKDKGTGLGLSISYQIVNEHNGKIEVTSNPDKGTSFCIYLPAV
ncbi:MAG: MASE3 domain-containing protein, partial [Syntrophomonadaceae bacterium]|nr:MASE3 domain-containing protein [Syntrophomonadaceae bacterium]